MEIRSESMGGRNEGMGRRISDQNFVKGRPHCTVLENDLTTLERSDRSRDSEPPRQRGCERRRATNFTDFTDGLDSKNARKNTRAPAQFFIRVIRAIRGLPLDYRG